MVEEVFGKLVGDLCWPNVIKGQEKRIPEQRIFCIPSFERICGYFPRKGRVSVVTGTTFIGVCDNTDMFAMGRSLIQSPALTLEVCQRVVV